MQEYIQNIVQRGEYIMLFSMVVPIYNSSQYLARCIESLLNQDMDSYEILLINDGSTDDSLRICQSYAAKYSQIKIVDKSNGGLSDARNAGIRCSKGDYLLFIDSDDYIESNCLVNLETMLKAHSYPDIIYAQYYMHDQGKNLIAKNYYSEENSYQDSYTFMKKELQLRNLPIAVCFNIYKRDLITSNNLYFQVGLLHEDERWSPQALFFSNRIYTTDFAFYHYVRRDGSITRSNRKQKNAVDLISTCKFLDEFVDENFNADRLMYSLMRNKNAMNYMYAVSIGKLYENLQYYSIDRFYPITHAYKVKDIIKACLFAVSPEFYCKLREKLFSI